jgi:hypothetical protein
MSGSARAQEGDEVRLWLGSAIAAHERARRLYLAYALVLIVAGIALAARALASPLALALPFMMMGMTAAAVSVFPLRAAAERSERCGALKALRSEWVGHRGRGVGEAAFVDLLLDLYGRSGRRAQ